MDDLSYLIGNTLESWNSLKQDFVKLIQANKDEGSAKVWSKIFTVTAVSVGGLYALVQLRRLFWFWYHKYHKIPNGPVGMPIVCSLPSLMINPRQYMRDIGKNYGDIASFYVGNYRIVLVSGLALTNQIWSQEEFLFRPSKSKSLKHGMTERVKEIAIVNQHDEWIVRRKIWFSSLMKLISNRELYNQVIYETVYNVMIPEIDKRINKNNFIFIDDICYFSVFNVYFRFVFGSNIKSMNDDLYLFIKEWALLIHGKVDIFWPSRFSLLFRKINHLLSKQSRIKDEKLRQSIENKHKVFEELVNNYLSGNGLELRSGSINTAQLQYTTIIDYMHGDLNRHSPRSKFKYEIKHMIDDIGSGFAVGLAPISASIEASIYLSVMYPKQFSLVYQQLCDHFGQSSSGSDNTDKQKIDIKDIENKCPLLKAFVYESMRLFNVGYISPARTTLTDAKVMVNNKEYIIPKNTILLSSVENVANDEKIWGNDANTFNMFRFLVKTGNLDEYILNPDIVRYHQFLFGFGKRDCLGKYYAVKLLFAVLSYVFLRYQFKPYHDLNKFSDTFANNIRVYNVNHFEPPLKVVALLR